MVMAQPHTLQDKFDEYQTNLVDLVDWLLDLAARSGEIRCTPIPPDHVRFEIRGEETCDVFFPQAKGRLRSMCARIAVLCQESGHEFMPYGGEGTIRQIWRARWSNTMGKQDFTLLAESAIDPGSEAP